MRSPSFLLAGLLLTSTSPIPVESEGRLLLAFELHLSQPPDEVKLIDPDSGRQLADYAGETLSKRLSVAKDKSVLYVELTQDAASLPHRLTPEIRYSSSLEHAAPIPVAAQAVDRVGPPFARGIWVAVHSPDWARGHRRVITAIDGKPRIPGRFAIDWVEVDDDGHIGRGDPDRPSDSFGYGEPVLSGADAKVAALRDGMAESASIKGNPKHALEAASGNYVALDLGDGHFLFYEHLKPGSVRVKPGQTVRRGDVIGELGFSGDSTGPHLHMHVADAPDPAGAEGLPFIQEGFVRIGRYADIGKLGQSPWEPEKEETRPDWPGPNLVGRFSK